MAKINNYFTRTYTHLLDSFRRLNSTKMLLCSLFDVIYMIVFLIFVTITGIMLNSSAVNPNMVNEFVKFVYKFLFGFLILSIILVLFTGFMRGLFWLRFSDRKFDKKQIIKYLKLNSIIIPFGVIFVMVVSLSAKQTIQPIIFLFLFFFYMGFSLIANATALYRNKISDIIYKSIKIFFLKAYCFIVPIIVMILVLVLLLKLIFPLFVYLPQNVLFSIMDTPLTVPMFVNFLIFLVYYVWIKYYIYVVVKDLVDKSNNLSENYNINIGQKKEKNNLSNTNLIDGNLNESVISNKKKIKTEIKNQYQNKKKAKKKTKKKKKI
jgi:hypothetical protein